MGGAAPLDLTRPGGILALDLSGTTGWAYGHVGSNAPPAFGIWRLPQIGGQGAKYAAFENELISAFAQLKPAKLILEAPFSFQAMLGVSTERVMMQQYTLRGFAYAEAWRNSVPCQEIDAFSVRRDVLGQGRFSKDRVKAEVVRYCHKRGWRVPDHNAGDACLTLEWLRGKLAGAAPVAGPLFRRERMTA